MDTAIFHIGQALDHFDPDAPAFVVCPLCPDEITLTTDALWFVARHASAHGLDQVDASFRDLRTVA
jgi:hypothetical protein